MLKPGLNSLRILRERLSRQKEYRDRLAAIKEFGQSDLWKSLKAVLELSKSGAEVQAQNALGDEISDPAVAHISAVRAEARRRTFDFVVALVDKSDSFIEEAEETLASLRNEIAKKEEALKEVGAAEEA